MPGPIDQEQLLELLENVSPEARLEVVKAYLQKLVILSKENLLRHCYSPASSWAITKTRNA